MLGDFSVALSIFEEADRWNEYLSNMTNDWTEFDFKWSYGCGWKFQGDVGQFVPTETLIPFLVLPAWIFLGRMMDFLEWFGTFNCINLSSKPLTECWTEQPLFFLSELK